MAARLEYPYVSMSLSNDSAMVYLFGFFFNIFKVANIFLHWENIAKLEVTLILKSEVDKTKLS
jgi:hypothetical protein